MKNISERVETEIIQLAKEHGIQKVILFGSRARGDNWERSDIDLAVSGGRHSPICAGSGRRGVNAAAV